VKKPRRKEQSVINEDCARFAKTLIGKELSRRLLNVEMILQPPAVIAYGLKRSFAQSFTDDIHGMVGQSRVVTRAV
jgi:hypothetical protein